LLTFINVADRITFAIFKSKFVVLSMSEAVTNHRDFIKTVTEIRSTEEEYESIISSAKLKAESMVSSAKSSVSDQKRKFEEELVISKTAAMKKGSDDLEKEVRQIVSKSKSESESISTKTLSDSVLSKMAKDFLSSI
jgi:vacuolar-type H+-ATPase subunit H